jgi:hypothetical protein
MTREEKEQQVIQDFQETFATDHGLRTLDRVALFCKEDDECYKGSTNDTLFNLGKRSVILMLRKQLKRKPNIKKQKEAINE